MANKKCLFVQTRFCLKKGGRQEFYRRFRDNNIREMSFSEDGNLEYEIYLPLDSDDDICILEKWESQEVYDLHSQTLHSAILEELKIKYAKKTVVKKGWLEEIDA